MPAPKKFAKLIGKYLSQDPFFNKVADATSNFIKKETPAEGFAVNFTIFEGTLSRELLRMTTFRVNSVFSFESMYVTKRYLGPCKIFMMNVL